MPCPFPGMDPFLEVPPFWSDFSPAFLTAIRNRLIPQVLPKYEVRVEEVVQRRLILTSRGSGSVVTVIEVLSPINKTPGRDGIESYERKREEILTTTIHLVELDLLRGGTRLPIKGNAPPGDYFAYIGRSERRPKCQIIGWEWRSALPTVRIPLLPEDGDVPLDLSAAFRDAYEPAYYDQRLPYDSAINPPLTVDDQKWVGQRISAL